MILVKNLVHQTNEDELREVFERFGPLKKALIAPYNTVGIIEFENLKHAKVAC